MCVSVAKTSHTETRLNIRLNFRLQYLITYCTLHSVAPAESAYLPEAHPRQVPLFDVDVTSLWREGEGTTGGEMFVVK